MYHLTYKLNQLIHRQSCGTYLTNLEEMPVIREHGRQIKELVVCR